MVTYVKISELPPATEATGDSEIEVNQAGVSRRITVDQIADVVAEILPSPVSDWEDITGKPDFDTTYVNTTGDTMTGPLVGTTATMSTAIPAASSDTTVATTAWVKANAGAAISTTATPPASPTDGQMWWNSDAASGGGQLYIRYNDGDTAQWVPATPIGGASPGSGSLVVTPDQFGIFGNPKGTASPTDETAAIAAMIESASDNGQTILWGDRLYAFDHVWLTKSDLFIRWRSQGTTILRSTKMAPDTVNGSLTGANADAFLDFATTAVRSITLASSVQAGQSLITLDSTGDLLENEHLLDFRTSRMLDTDNRSSHRHGWVVPIHRIINATDVVLAKPIPVASEVGNIAGGTVVSRTASTVVVAGLSTRSRNEVMYQLLFTTVGGVAASLSAMPMTFDVATQTYTFDTVFTGGAPVGLIAGDTFEVVRTVTVNVQNSTKVDIEGFILERAPHTGATTGDLGFRGLRPNFSLAPRIVNVQTRNFSEAGMSINCCYAPHVDGVRAEGSNNTSTGYGVSNAGSSWGVYRNIYGFNCRRTLDFGGGGPASYHCLADNIHGYGGGLGYDDAAWWPDSAVSIPTVVGSHGGAYYTKYVNCHGFNVWGIMNLRGFDESVQGVYGAGRIETMINAGYGDGIVADSIHYTNGIASWVTDPLAQHGYPAGATGNYWLTSVIILNSATVIPTRPWMLSNLHIRGVDKAVVDMGGPGTCGPIFISGAIDIMTADFTGANDTFWVVRPTGSGTRTMLGPVRIGPANLLALPQVTAPAIPKTLIEPCLVDSSGWDWTAGSYVRYPNGTYVFFIDNDAVFKLPVNNNPTTGWVSIRPTSNTAPIVTLINAQLSAASGFNSAPLANMSANVAIINGILTGTTGVVGNLSVAYRPSGGDEAIYVENRTGVRRSFVMTCDNAL